MLGLVVLHLMRSSTNSSTVSSRLPNVKFSLTLPLLLRSSMYAVLVGNGSEVTHTGCILVPVALMPSTTEMTWSWQTTSQGFLGLLFDLTVGSPSVTSRMILALSKSFKVSLQSANAS